MTAHDLQERLRTLANPQDAAFLQGFFKTGPGQYGEGDLFLGIRVPVLRSVAKEHWGLPLKEAAELLQSLYHEERLTALLILVAAYRKAKPEVRQRIYDLYLGHTRFINNWDLVDTSAAPIVGAHLEERDRAPLYDLARSPLLWERRIAIIATFHYIRAREYGETLRIAEMLLRDREDLIHKAVGWMLREIGNRDREAEEGFLRAHCRIMPRTMLRYAIEKFPEDLRQRYLKGQPD